MHFLTANRGSYDPRSIPYMFPNVAVPSHLSIPGTSRHHPIGTPGDEVWYYWYQVSGLGRKEEGGLPRVDRLGLRT
jgi:hypothetical protein